MPDSAAARQRRRRARLAGLEPEAVVLICARCGRSCTGKYKPFCQRCWLAVEPAGRATIARAVAKSRRRKRDNQ